MVNRDKLGKSVDRLHIGYTLEPLIRVKVSAVRPVCGGMMRRRSKGEGGIYRREDGRWCAAIDLGQVRGKRRRRVCLFAREQLVEHRAQRVDVAADRDRGAGESFNFSR